MINRKTILLICFFLSFLLLPGLGYSILTHLHQNPNHFKYQFEENNKSVSTTGVDLLANYYQFVLGDPVGQVRGFAHIEGFTLDTYLDFSKLAKVKGLSAHLGIVWIGGNNLETKTGSEFPLMSIYGSRTWILGNLYIQQIAKGGAFRFKVGRIMMGDDFLTSPLRLKLLSLAFRSQIALYINTPAPGYPYAAWGAYGEHKISSNWRYSLGLFSVNKGSYANKFHGLDLTLDTHDSAQINAEIERSIISINDRAEVLGAYKAGLVIFKRMQKRLLPEGKSGNYALYLSADQKILSFKCGIDRGVYAFSTFLFFPKDRNIFSKYFTGGLVLKGVFPSRLKDTLSLGLAKGWYSSSYTGKPQNTETLIELNYWARISRHLQITPAIQYVINPQGLGKKNALVIGLQMVLSI